MAESVYTTQFVSENPDASGGSGLTLSTLVVTNIFGVVSHIRRIKTPTPPIVNEGILYHRTSETVGEELASGNVWVDDPVTGWQRAAIGPVAIQAGEYYPSCYTDRFSSDVDSSPLKAGPIVNGHLTAPQDDAATPRRNGRAYLEGRGYPDFGAGNTYYIDFVFIPGSVVALTPAVLTPTAQAVTPVVPFATVSLTPAVLTPIAVPLSVSAGLVVVALTPAVLPIIAVAVRFQGGITPRPNTGTTARPFTGITTRP